MEQRDSRTGFFGKLASHGDFVTRRLSPAFVRNWDEWLQAGLKHSRDRLSPKWQTTYLCSPIWHFALAPDVCAEPGWAGVMMPSVDRVGRYFPLTLAYGGHEAPLLDRLANDGAWYAELEALALSSLQEGFSLEDFDTALSTLRPPCVEKGVSEVVGRRVGMADDLWLSLPEMDGFTLADALPVFASQLVAQRDPSSLAGHCLFWTEGSPHMPPSVW